MADPTPDNISVNLSGIINLPVATETTDGLVELADVAETRAGVDNTQAITPAAGAATYLAISEFTAKGDILTATGESVQVALPVGDNGQVLSACDLSETGLCWTTPPAPIPSIPCACVTNKGAIITGNAPETPVALSVGGNGQVLSACSLSETGLCWVTLPEPVPPIPRACVINKGTIVTGSAPESPIALPVGSNGQVLTACSQAASGLCWVSLPPSSSSTVSVLARPGVIALTMGNLRVCFTESGNRTWAFSTVNSSEVAIVQTTSASNTTVSTQMRALTLRTTAFSELGWNFVCTPSCATYMILMGPTNAPNAVYCFVGMVGCNYMSNLFSLTRLL